MCGRMIFTRIGGNRLIRVYCTYGELRQGGYGWIMYGDHPALYAEGPGCDDERADACDALWSEVQEQAISAGIDVVQLELQEDV